jgi:hypothetical protein
MTKRKARATARRQQIPFRNDRKKGKGNCKNNSGFPKGMTKRRARTKASQTRGERSGRFV